MIDYGTEEYDDKTFKAYQIIKKYKNNKSEKDMIKEIVEIL